MKAIRCALLLLMLPLAGCGRQPAASTDPRELTAATAAQVDKDVRAFMQTVAHDVTLDGPIAWLRHFAGTPAFFMAANGQLAFPDSAAAIKGTQAFAQTNQHIELVWGSDLRVDPLTPELAVVAASWREVQVNTAGKRVDESGFFTGVAEYRDGRWQLRDAHWSEAVPPAAAK